AHRLAVDRIVKNPSLPIAVHDLQLIGAEIRDQDVAVARKRETVWQRACKQALGLVPGKVEMLAFRLRYELLLPVRPNPHHAAARIGSPECPIALGKDAFGPLQIPADGADLRSIDLPTLERVRSF